MDFSRPGKPTDNPFIKSFNGSLRDECLNIHWFLSLEDAQDKLDNWRREYNHERTHSSLNDMIPAEFIRSIRKDEDLGLSTALILGQGQFFRSLKSKWVPTKGYNSFSEAQSAIIRYITGYYSAVRPHWYNGGLMPNESERLYYIQSNHESIGRDMLVFIPKKFMHPDRFLMFTFVKQYLWLPFF